LLLQVWFKFLAWLSPFVFSPFYLVAIYAIIKGREWIRTPIIIYSSALTLDLLVIMAEEGWGEYASPNFTRVWLGCPF